MTTWSELKMENYYVPGREQFQTRSQIKQLH